MGEKKFFKYDDKVSQKKKRKFIAKDIQNRTFFYERIEKKKVGDYRKQKHPYFFFFKGNLQHSVRKKPYI